MKFLPFLRGRQDERGRRQNAASTEARLLALSRAVGDTLRKHGIPASWVGAETLPAKTPSEQKGVHLRLVVRNANPRLLVHLHALQRAIHTRLGHTDAQAAQWLMGTSWRLDVPLGSDTYELPGPEFWQGNFKGPVSRPASGVQDAARDTVVRKLAMRDAAFTPTTWDSPEFLPTQPIAAM